MATHVLVNKKELLRVLEELQELVSKSPDLPLEVTAPGIAPPTKETPKYDEGRKATIGNLIVDLVKLEKFTPRQVYEVIFPRYPNSQNPRFIDAIRTTLRGDRRFERIENTPYYRVKK